MKHEAVVDRRGNSKPDGFNVHAFCIGAAKSGSTWLACVVDEHPDVQVSEPKETKFLTPLSGDIYLTGPDATFLSDWGWYESCFAEQGKVNVDFTVHMLPDPLAPARVKIAFPDAKFILMLRDPVERAWSHYQHLLRAKAAKVPCMADVEPDISDYDYQYRSMYAQQLEPWLEAFPRERFLVVTKEEADTAPLELVRKVYRHLAVDDSFTPRRLNRRLYPGSVRRRFLRRWVDSVMPGIVGRLLTWYPPPDPLEAFLLRLMFTSDVERLESIFDLDLEGWKTRLG